MDETDKVVDLIRRWKPAPLKTPGAEWWEWAVAAAQYHLPDCDWVVGGVSMNHCSCALTRVIAKIMEEARCGAENRQASG